MATLDRTLTFAQVDDIPVLVCQDLDFDMAGAFHQRRLEQEVTVEILDADREVLARQRVQGADVRNNSWFTVDFPAIEKKTELYVRVSTREPARSKSFILWLDPAGDLCVQSFYRVEPESMAAQ